jgi:hypothetical protein
MMAGQWRRCGRLHIPPDRGGKVTLAVGFNRRSVSHVFNRTPAQIAFRAGGAFPRQIAGSFVCSHTIRSAQLNAGLMHRLVISLGDFPQNERRQTQVAKDHIAQIDAAKAA